MVLNARRLIRHSSNDLSASSFDGALKLDQLLRLDELRCPYYGFHASDYAARVHTLKTK
jgi:hypothetical protein